MINNYIGGDSIYAIVDDDRWRTSVKGCIISSLYCSLVRIHLYSEIRLSSSNSKFQFLSFFTLMLTNTPTLRKFSFSIEMSRTECRETTLCQRNLKNHGQTTRSRNFISTSDHASQAKKWYTEKNPWHSCLVATKKIPKKI